MRLRGRRVWFPLAHQIFIVERQQTTYLRSVWTGVTAPLLNLPTMVYDSILKPMALGIFEVITAVVMGLYIGFSGRLIGFEVEGPDGEDAPSDPT